MGARIFRVAQRLAKLTAENSFGPAQTPGKVMEEMVKYSKNDLDPKIVQSMFDLILQYHLLPASATEIEDYKQQITTTTDHFRDDSSKDIQRDS